MSAFHGPEKRPAGHAVIRKTGNRLDGASGPAASVIWFCSVTIYGRSLAYRGNGRGKILVPGIHEVCGSSADFPARHPPRQQSPRSLLKEPTRNLAVCRCMLAGASAVRAAIARFDEGGRVTPSGPPLEFSRNRRIHQDSGDEISIPDVTADGATRPTARQDSFGRECEDSVNLESARKHRSPRLGRARPQPPGWP